MAADPTTRQLVEVDQPYVAGAPDPATAAAVFGDAWVTRLDDLLGVRRGAAELFRDARVPWLLERPELGLRPGRTTILDLGTLEGAHAHGFAEAGARVVAVEAHAAAWVRGLALAEMRTGRTEAARPRIVLGEATAYLRRAAAAGAGADLVVASGLLYHLTDPFAFLAAARAVSPLLFVWTHYFDHDWFESRDPDMLQRFGPATTAPGPAGVVLPARRHGYLRRLGGPAFSGGSADHSLWLELDGLRSALVAAGFPVLVECFQNLEHPNGPSTGFLAHDPAGSPGDADGLWARPWTAGGEPDDVDDADRTDGDPGFRILAAAPAPAPPTPPPTPTDPPPAPVQVPRSRAVGRLVGGVGRRLRSR